MIAAGPRPKLAFPEGFFAVAAAQNPKPRTVAIVGADAEFAKASTDGARRQASTSARAIFDDYRLPQPLGKCLADEPADDVRNCPGGNEHDQ
jgi:branched-chain amino acid transport system substrate-binding protein